MVHDDSIRMDAPAAQEELKRLLAAVVGEKRKGPLFPALPMPVEWVLVAIEGKRRWTFEARFAGELILRTQITADSMALTVDILKEAS